ncbi:MAG: hypothetical protein JW827_02850 [Spirochaetes bacterium]|nr:hypothetical protein [Spirochaetota bacterium]
MIRIIAILIFFFLSALNLLAEKQIKETSLIYKKSQAIILNLNRGEMNNTEFLNLNYYIKKARGDDIKDIYNYYITQLGPKGYRKDKYQTKKTKESDTILATFMGDEYVISINITDDKRSRVVVILSIMNNEFLFKKNALMNKSNEDNPGFDIPDIPRYQKTKRLLSTRTTDMNERTVRQVMYQMEGNKKAVVRFYEIEMALNKWKKINQFEFSGYITMSYVKKNRKAEILIHYNPEVKKDVIMILEE